MRRELSHWHTVRESNPCRRRERNAIHSNSLKLRGMDSTLPHLKDSRGRLLDSHWTCVFVEVDLCGSTCPIGFAGLVKTLAKTSVIHIRATKSTEMFASTCMDFNGQSFGSFRSLVEIHFSKARAASAASACPIISLDAIAACTAASNVISSFVSLAILANSTSTHGSLSARRVGLANAASRCSRLRDASARVSSFFRLLVCT